VSHGLAPRQGRAYREIFQLVREQLASADTTDDSASPDAASPLETG
jgi:ribosome-associated protein